MISSNEMYILFDRQMRDHASNVNRVCEYDWTGKWMTIASKENSVHLYYLIDKWGIIVRVESKDREGSLIPAW